MGDKTHHVRILIGAGLTDWIEREAKRLGVSDRDVIWWMLCKHPVVIPIGRTSMDKGINVPQRAMIIRDLVISLTFAVLIAVLFTL